jgi:hypothetical protein
VLSARYIKSVGAEESLSEFADLMDGLCHPLDVTTTEGDSPAALGNRIAAAVLAYGLTDGSNEAGGYAPPEYEPVNPPLVVAESGATMTDPNRWQPLQLEHMISQNGVPIENGVQQFIGPHWGHVAGFALPEVGADGVPLDPGPPPHLGDAASDQAYKDEAVEVIEKSSQLDPTDGVTIDISPAAMGANPLGTNDGQGYPVNPVTGKPYEPNVVKQGDFARALTEFWADGPKSETPPGHWNVVANTVSDALDPDLRIEGEVRWRPAGMGRQLYFALNGPSDAAVARGLWRLRASPPDLDDPAHGGPQSTDRSLPRSTSKPAARRASSRS